MENTLSELRRRFHADPSNKQVLNALTRGLAVTGKTVEAYHLLFDHGGVEENDPLALELGARLSKLEAPLLSKRLGRDSKFASQTRLRGGWKAWDYQDFSGVRENKFPVLAIKAQGTRALSKILLENLAGFPALRLLSLNQPNTLTNKTLLAIPQHPSLRHLILSFVNSGPNKETIQRDTFKHLCTFAMLTTLRVNNCKIAPKDIELCALQPNLAALYLGFENTERCHLEFLTQLKRLKSLSLHCPQNSETKLPQLTESLVTLELFETSPCGADLESLTLPNLQNLILTRMGVDDRQLESIAERTAIKTLELEGNPDISDKGLKHLIKMPALEKLSLSHCVGISAKALETLIKIPKLRFLVLPLGFDTLATERVRRENPGLTINIGFGLQDYWRLKSSLWLQCMGFIA